MKKIVELLRIHMLSAVCPMNNNLKGRDLMKKYMVNGVVCLGGEELPSGTFHCGGEELPSGTFHAA